MKANPSMFKVITNTLSLVGKGSQRKMDSAIGSHALPPHTENGGIAILLSIVHLHDTIHTPR